MSRLSIFAAIAATLLAVIGFSPVAQAQCQPFPQVSWWGQSSHAKEIRIVGRRFGGDWASYIARWEESLSRIEKIRAKGKTAMFGSGRIKLRDDELDAFIETVRRRLTVTRCLAGEATAAATTKNSDTIGGGGGDRLADRPDPLRLSSVIPDLEVRGQCRSSRIEFRVVNTGKEWTGVGVFSIVDGKGKPVINERRLRLIEHQTATFRIDRANTDTNVLTFRVDPTWSGATPHEATLECRDRQLASAR